MSEQKICPKCNIKLTKWLNSRIKDSEFGKKNLVDVEQWKYICPKCEYCEIVKYTEAEYKKRKEYLDKESGGGE